MKIRMAPPVFAFVAAIFAANPTLAQSGADGAQKAPEQHQPGETAKTAPASQGDVNAGARTQSSDATAKLDPAKHTELYYAAGSGRRRPSGRRWQSAKIYGHFLHAVQRKCVAECRNRCDGDDLCKELLDGRYSGPNSILRNASWEARGENVAGSQPAVSANGSGDGAERGTDRAARDVERISGDQTDVASGRRQTRGKRAGAQCGSSSEARARTGNTCYSQTSSTEISTAMRLQKRRAAFLYSLLRVFVENGN